MARRSCCKITRAFPLSSVTTGTCPPPINFRGQLGRVNFLRSEPTNAPQWSSRFFVNDLNAHLYILARATKTFTPYINFALVFPKFDSYPGYAGGLVTFVFDPDYASNGKFYTVHTEDPAKSGSALPTTTNLPGLDERRLHDNRGSGSPCGHDRPGGGSRRMDGHQRERRRVRRYGARDSAGRIRRRHSPDGRLAVQSWPSPSKATTAISTSPWAMEVRRNRRRDSRHAAAPGCHPGQDSEITRTSTGIRRTPSVRTVVIASRSRFGPQPFVSVSGAMREIYACGFRNPHRLSWDPVQHANRQRHRAELVGGSRYCHQRGQLWLRRA